ncbi:heme-binding protein [Mycobacterium barrassiae]|uniref:hemophore-related protein n=1 Tax=Mycobacterium barrassiae TaxID=319709 RepID=UPI002265E4A5|nr:hemophore-related protein [Mycobacterium barrassiae]MCV7303144.1 heme-binding protein [Mycobacterium barrassiae]
MKMSEKTVRRGLYGMFAGGLLAFGSAAIVMPVANAQPAENCSVSAIADTSRTVSESTSTYLEHNSDANDELTDIMNSTPSDVTQAFRVYFAENPQVETELRAINQPAIDLASQCGVEVAPTPITEALTDL